MHIDSYTNWVKHREKLRAEIKELEDLKILMEKERDEIMMNLSEFNKKIEQKEFRLMRLDEITAAMSEYVEIDT